MILEMVNRAGTWMYDRCQISKRGALGPGMIKGAIVALIFLTVFVSILPDLIETSADSVQTLAEGYTANATLYGTGASTIGGKIDDWMGYFWVLGPFVLIIGIVVKLFMGRR